MSAIGALAYRADGSRSRLFLRLKRGPVLAEDFVRFLKHLGRHLSGRVVVIWDRLHGHRSVLVREWTADQQRFAVNFLPAYAPGLNPVEALWSWVKGTCLARARRGSAFSESANRALGGAGSRLGAGKGASRAGCEGEEEVPQLASRPPGVGRGRPNGAWQGLASPSRQIDAGCSLRSRGGPPPYGGHRTVQVSILGPVTRSFACRDSMQGPGNAGDRLVRRPRDGGPLPRHGTAAGQGISCGPAANRSSQAPHAGRGRGAQGPSRPTGEPIGGAAGRTAGTPLHPRQ